MFVIKRLGLVPRLAVESSDTGTARLEKIMNLIRSCRFGMHELSRIVSNEQDELYRVNMPF